MSMEVGQPSTNH